jgi:YVTN family beta-propeller protein
VSVIDTATLAVSGPGVAAGISLPSAWALAPGGGLLYVADTGADEVLVVDTDLLTVKGRILLPGAPHGVAVSHDGKTLVVTLVTRRAGRSGHLMAFQFREVLHACPAAGRLGFTVFVRQRVGVGDMLPLRRHLGWHGLPGPPRAVAL